MNRTVKIKNNRVKNQPERLTIQVDENGLPLEKFWRKKFIDAKTDNCIEIIEPTKEQGKASSKKPKQKNTELDE